MGSSGEVGGVESEGHVRGGGDQQGVKGEC